MVLIRKARAGSDSHGNVWAYDNATVDVAPHIAATLVDIPDGGFAEAVDAREPEPGSSTVDLDALAALLEERARVAGSSTEASAETDKTEGPGKSIGGRAATKPRTSS